MTKEEKIELIKDAAFFGGTIPSSKYEEMREFFDKLEAHVKAGVTSEGDKQEGIRKGFDKLCCQGDFGHWCAGCDKLLPY